MILRQLTSFVAPFASLVSKVLTKASAGLRSQPTMLPVEMNAAHVARAFDDSPRIAAAVAARAGRAIGPLEPRGGAHRVLSSYYRRALGRSMRDA